eukprot:gene5945-7404_t
MSTPSKGRSSTVSSTVGGKSSTMAYVRPKEVETPVTTTTPITPSKKDKKEKKEKKEKSSSSSSKSKESKEERKERKEKEKAEKKDLKIKEKEEKKQAKEEKRAARKASKSSGSGVSTTDTDGSSEYSNSTTSSLSTSNQSRLADSMRSDGGLENGTGPTTSAPQSTFRDDQTSTGIYSTQGSSGAQSTAQKESLISDQDIFSSESFLIAVSDTDHLGPAIKSVFESNKEKEVMKSLNAYISLKDADIEKICGENHEGFINAVTAFLGLKQENTELKQSVINLNYELQETGSRYVNKAEELMSYKRIKDNIKRTKEILNNCQYAILLRMKIDDYVKEKKYYHAIKNLDQLHNVYLKRLSDFQFARNMDFNIPILKEEIKKLVKDEFNSWMVQIKERSAIIGKLGMVQSAKKLEKERTINPLKAKTSFGENEETWDKILDLPVTHNTSIIGSLSSGNHSNTNSPSSNNQSLSPSLRSMIKDIDEKDLLKEEIIQASPFDEATISFHPLYQCLFIYSSLGLLEEFQGYYTLNRLLQFQLVIQPKENGQIWEIFLQQIAGYFMIESRVMDSTAPFLSKTTINDCWNSALVKVTSVLQELFTHCHDTSSLIAFKKFVLIFTTTLSYYSYHVQPLYYLLDTMKEKYCQFAIKESIEKFTQILEKESYASLVIDTQEEYQSYILVNNLDPEYDKEKPVELPKSFFFSKMVPQFYALIKKFISEFYEFADQLTENENFIIRSTDTLIKKINEVLYSYLTQSQAVPQNHGEKLIIKLCDRKIEDLMSSSANINWFPMAMDDRPRDYIEDVCTFLDVTLPFISPLSQNLREEFITKAFKKISEVLFSIIHSESLKKFNLCGVKCFNSDLKFIEEFVKQKASDKERTTTSSRNLVGYFVELRQLVNLLLSENPEEYGDSKIRAKSYNLLTNIPQLIMLFNKYKEESKGFTTPKEIKDRNKKIADAIKQFKEMQ